MKYERTLQRATYNTVISLPIMGAAGKCKGLLSMVVPQGQRHLIAGKVHNKVLQIWVPVQEGTIGHSKFLRTTRRLPEWIKCGIQRSIELIPLSEYMGARSRYRVCVWDGSLIGS